MPELTKMDASLRHLRPEFAYLLGKLRMLIDQKGLPLRMIEGFRSNERQDYLFAQGRTRPGDKITVAQGGQSPHNHGLGADWVFLTGGGGVTWNGPWEVFGVLAKQAGLIWGGDWQSKDLCHVEHPNWKQMI